MQKLCLTREQNSYMTNTNCCFTVSLWQPSIESCNRLCTMIHAAAIIVYLMLSKISYSTYLSKRGGVSKKYTSLTYLEEISNTL